jgi:hypothetical protein
VFRGGSIKFHSIDIKKSDIEKNDAENFGKSIDADKHIQRPRNRGGGIGSK